MWMRCVAGQLVPGGVVLTPARWPTGWSRSLVEHLQPLGVRVLPVVAGEHIVQVVGHLHRLTLRPLGQQIDHPRQGGHLFRRRRSVVLADRAGAMASGCREPERQGLVPPGGDLLPG